MCGQYPLSTLCSLLPALCSLLPSLCLQLTATIWDLAGRSSAPPAEPPFTTGSAPLQRLPRKLQSWTSVIPTGATTWQETLEPSP